VRAIGKGSRDETTTQRGELHNEKGQAKLFKVRKKGLARGQKQCEVAKSREKRGKNKGGKGAAACQEKERYLWN